MTTPEENARKQIENLLTLVGWTIQNRSELNLGVSLGVAIRFLSRNWTLF